MAWRLLCRLRPPPRAASGFSCLFPPAWRCWPCDADGSALPRPRQGVWRHCHRLPRGLGGRHPSPCSSRHRPSLLLPHASPLRRRRRQRQWQERCRQQSRRCRRSRCSNRRSGHRCSRCQHGIRLRRRSPPRRHKSCDHLPPHPHCCQHQHQHHHRCCHLGIHQRQRPSPSQYPRGRSHRHPGQTCSRCSRFIAFLPLSSGPTTGASAMA